MSDERFRTTAEVQADSMFEWVDTNEFMETFIKKALNEANYWMGYKAWFKRIIPDDDLEDTEDLTKKAATLKGRLYKAVGLRTEHVNKRLSMMRAGGFFSEDEQKVYDKELTDLENQIITAGYDVFRQREPFIEYLGYMDLSLRTKYKPRAKKEDEE